MNEEPVDSTVGKVLKLLLDLAQDKYYGKIVLQFEAGKIQLVRQETTIKPDDL